MATATIRDAWNCSFVNEADPTAMNEGLDYIRVGDANGKYTRSNYIYIGWISGGSAVKLSSVIPLGARIDNVYFTFYLRSKGFSGKTYLDVNIRPVTQTFNAGLMNWNNRDTRAPVGDLITSFREYSTATAGLKTYCSGDAALKAYFQNLIDTDAYFYGLRFSHTDISPAGDTAYINYKSAWAKVYEDTPTLVIEYTPDTVPSVTCSAATNVDHDGATMNGEVVSDGGSPITDTYFQLSTQSDFSNWWEPDNSDNYFTVQVSDSVGVKSANVALPEGKSFYYRLVCTNALGAGTSLPVRMLTTKSINATAGMGGDGKTHELTGTTRLGDGGDGGGKPGALLGHLSQSTGGAGSTSGNGSAAQANTGSGGGGAGPSGTGGTGGSGLAVVRYKTEDAVSAQYVTDAKAFNPSIAFQRGKLFVPYYAAGSKVTVDVTTIGSGTSPVITCEDSIDGLVNGMGVTITNSGSAAIDGNWIVANVNTGAKTFTITPGTTVVGNSPTGCKAVFNAYVGIQDTSDLLAPIGWLKTSRSAMEMLTIKKKFKYISVIHEPFESDEYVGCGWTLDGTEATGVPDIQSPTETIFPIHDEGYSIDVTLSLIADRQLSISPKVTAVHVVWSFVKNKVHQYSLLCVRGANGGRWNKNPKKAIQFLFANAGDVLTFEERFAGTYQGTIDAVDFNQGQASLSDDASGPVRLTVVEET